MTALYRSDASGGSYTGTLVAKYAYDPFGQVLSVTNASGTAISPTAANVANYNPFRYRGYYYDTESGFYYLQSRYYDPEICRFINADQYASTGLGFLGCNMFAYCNNNPVMQADPSGEDPNFNAIKQMADAGYGGGGGGVITWLLVFLGYEYIKLNAEYAMKAIDAITSVPLPIGSTFQIRTITEEAEVPDVTYPGNDATKAPEGYEWRGSGPEGSDKGSWYNPETGESWHPDLNHSGDIGGHWDYNYKGSGSEGWRVFPDGSIISKSPYRRDHKIRMMVK